MRISSSKRWKYLGAAVFAIVILTSVAYPFFLRDQIRGNPQLLINQILLSTSNKFRHYEVRHTRYFQYGPNQDGEEAALESALSTALNYEGNFCYRVVTNPSQMVFADHNKRAFEIWAIKLKKQQMPVQSKIKPVLCVPTTSKEPMGDYWSDIEFGRTVVLHFPSPKDGPDSNGWKWAGGISYSDIYK